MMRIAHVSATFPPYQAGTGNVCYHNALELVKRGHEVHVFTAAIPDSPYEENMQGVIVHRLKPLFRFGNAPFLPGLLRLKRFDIVHLHHPFIFGAEMVWMVSTLQGMPYVLTHHNDLIGTGLKGYLFDLYSAIWTRVALDGAAKFAVVSKDHAAYCRLTPLFKKRWEDLVEVDNGVDVDLFRPGLNGAEIRMKAQIPEGAKMILFVGPLDEAHYYRRVDLLIQAFSIINDPNNYLLIIGDGNKKNHYARISNQYGISNNIIFAGKIQNERLPYFYNAANLLVLPSSIQETFGIVLIEAMACGVPVIASDLPGVRSVVNDGVDGYLVEPGNVGELATKIEKMLSLPVEVRQVMGARGREKVVSKYTWESAGKKLECIYQDILRGNQ